MIHLVLPDERMRARLQGVIGEARLSVWQPGEGTAPPAAIDLLVLPYMMPATELVHLNALTPTVVQSQMLGYDGVAEHLPAGFTFCNAVDVHEGSTAELALGLILAAQRGVADAVLAAQRGAWERAKHPGLAGKRVLLLGAGGVGAEIIRRLAAFDAELRVLARRAREGVWGLDALTKLLPWADIVVVAIPLNDQTRRMVDADFLAAMKNGALIVNVSRGEIVDTDALLNELQTQRLRAALDVTDPEPLPPGHPLWTAPNTIITPHLGGNTDAMDARIDRIIIEQLRRRREGQPPLNQVLGAAG